MEKIIPNHRRDCVSFNMITIGNLNNRTAVPFSSVALALVKKGMGTGVRRGERGKREYDGNDSIEN